MKFIDIVNFNFLLKKSNKWIGWLFIIIYIILNLGVNLYRIYSVEIFTENNFPKGGGLHSTGLFESFGYNIYIDCGILGLLTYYALILGGPLFLLIKGFRNRKKKKSEETE